MENIKLTLELECPGYEQYIVETHIEEFAPGEEVGIGNCAWYTFKFPNNYGVLVGKAKFTKGYSLDRWQLDPIKFADDEDDFYYIAEDTILSIKDLLRSRGSLTDVQVCEYLEKYKNL